MGIQVVRKVKKKFDLNRKQNTAASNRTITSHLYIAKFGSRNESDAYSKLDCKLLCDLAYKRN